MTDMEKHLSHDAFFDGLGRLFTSRRARDRGSVFLTQKRMSYGPLPSNEVPLADLAAASSNVSWSVLMRATNAKSGDDRKAGKRVKLSTIVQSDALDVFYVRYADVCKAGMIALKPRDRSKRKTKAKNKKKVPAA